MAAQTILPKIVNALGNVKGVAAVGLGGSRMIGRANPNSDFDIAIFYDHARTISAGDMQAAIAPIADGSIRITGDIALVEFTIQGHKVEFFFNDIGLILQEIKNARQGKFSRTPDMLRPYGFLSTVRISYATYALSLWDPERKLAALVQQATPYPDALKGAMLNTFRQEAQLNLMHASKVKSLDELPYLAALYGRIISCWTNSLFAINRRYPLIDKGTLHVIMSLPLHPNHYRERAIRLLQDIASNNLQQAHQNATALHKEICAFS